MVDAHLADRPRVARSLSSMFFDVLDEVGSFYPNLSTLGLHLCDMWSMYQKPLRVYSVGSGSRCRSRLRSWSSLQKRGVCR
jgi:hypothetical protein